ncbi:hypothetical protein HYD53_03740 [Mycoplasmopsis bovis]|nr:hypothetical protein [Mycoplasmopsis bovis]QQH72164.1 hypothetical protein HYD53_03740 [Mycoplasmopsis bovis]
MFHYRLKITTVKYYDKSKAKEHLSQYLKKFRKSSFKRFTIKKQRKLKLQLKYHIKVPALA